MAIVYPTLTDEFRLARLEPPKGIVHCVLDTDTYNEVDDQFALAYAMLSPERIVLDAVHAAPFDNPRSKGPEDGMLRSFEEIERVVSRIKPIPQNFIFEGARKWIRDNDGKPVDSPAARNLIRLAMERPVEDPLYVLAIAAPTNVASAIMMEPEIIRHIVVIWLGGQPHYWPTAHEFNLYQDVNASQVLFDSGVPLLQIPCSNVAEHLRVSIPYLEKYLEHRSALGDYLTDIVRHYAPADDPTCFVKVIWDITTVAWLINDKWFPSELTQSPILHEDFTYSFDRTRHLIRVATHVDAVAALFKDLFTRIGNLGYK